MTESESSSASRPADEPARTQEGPLTPIEPSGRASSPPRLLSTLIAAVLVLTLIIGVAAAGYIIYQYANPPAPLPPSIEFSSVETGEIVTIAATARGEWVTRAELWAGDAMLAREVNPNPALSNPWSLAWQWQPPGPGVYPMVARVYDEAGGYGASLPFNVVVPPRAKLIISSNRDGAYGLYELETHTRASGIWQPPMSQARQAAVFGKTAAFARNKDGRWQIVSRALDQPTLTELTPDLAMAQRPAWSADGKQIAFEVNNGTSTNVFVSDADGKNRRQLTNTDAYDGQPSFSPSGDALAFAAQQGSQWDIYSIALDGSALVRLTSDPAQDAQPSWSPDGKRIAFVSNRGGIAQVWVMNADGSNPEQLTNIPSGAEQPKWSPDGNWLAFVAATGAGEGNNRREIYLLYAPPSVTDPALRALIRLTQNDKDDTEPAWVP